MGDEGAIFAFVAGVVKVNKVLFPFARERGRVDGVAVVLARDMAATRCQVERWDVVGAVAVLELDGSGTGGQCEQLVPETDAHDRDLGGFHQLAEMVHCVLAMGGVPGAV